MKKFFLVLPAFLITLCISSSVFAETITTDQGPCAYVPENIYSFAPVIEGTTIKHDFIVINKGSAPLNIENVRTG
jgi:hypothetical protein